MPAYDETNHPCIKCLIESENSISSGNWRKLPEKLLPWYEMLIAENLEVTRLLKKLQPKKILEIGCGAGRIIDGLLKIDYAKDIIAVDKNRIMADYAARRFSGVENIKVLNRDAGDFILKSEEKFDLIISMMNTLGNINNIELLKKLMKKTCNLLFTLYDKDFYELRKEIYLSKGHKDFIVKEGNYYFFDDWAHGLVSRSFFREDIEKICEKLKVPYKIYKISKLLFMVQLWQR